MRADPVQVSLLSSETRAVLLGIDRLATAGREMDAPTAELLSRVHDDLLALIDVLESDRTPSSAGCRVFPGEI